MMPTGGIEAVQNGKSDALMKVAGRGCSIEMDLHNHLQQK